MSNLQELSAIERDALELLIDEHSLYHVTQALARICADKHEHICASYGPESYWEAQSLALTELAEGLE